MILGNLHVFHLLGSVTQFVKGEASQIVNLHNNLTIVTLLHVSDTTTRQKYSFYLYPVPKIGYVIHMSGGFGATPWAHDKVRANLLGNRWWGVWCNVPTGKKLKTVLN